MTTLAELILKADYRQIDGASTSLDRLTSTGEKSIGMVNRLAGALGVAFGVREIIEASEAYTTINNRLSLVTDSSEELAAAQQDVFEIAQKTRSPLKETAEVYQRLATNADALGMSLAEVGDTTETINKLMVISGTSGASAAAALTQLGQAFASGTLRGEELNSVMEQAPALAKAIADGMGVTVGQLRALGQEGKITADAVVEALQKQGAAVDEQFGKMAPTIGQAMTQVGNSFINYVGKVDKATGASGELASAIVSISEALDNSILSETTRLFATWGASFEDASTNAAPLATELNNVAFGAKAIGWYIKEAFITLPSNVKAMTGIASVWVADFIESTSNRFTRAKERWNAIWTDDTWEAANKRYKDRAKILQDASEDSISAILAQRDAEIEAGQAAADAAMRSVPGGALDAKGTGKGAAQSAVDDAKKSKRLEVNAIETQLLMQADIDAEMQRRALLEQQFATEREAELLRYEQKLADFAAYQEAFGLSDADAKAKREALEQEHQDKLVQIARDAAAKDKSTLSYKLGASQKFMNDLYTASGAHSNRMTKMIQSVGAAQALVNAYLAASQALADPTVPFFAKFAAVAQVIATGMGLVNAIKGGGGSAGGGSATATTPDTSGITSTQQQQVRAQTLDIRVQSRGLWRDEDVAELMQAIGDKLGDGAKFGRVEFMQI